MSVYMRQKIPITYERNHSDNNNAEDQKFTSSPGWNRLNLRSRMLKTNIELKTN